MAGASPDLPSLDEVTGIVERRRSNNRKEREKKAEIRHRKRKDAREVDTVFLETLSREMQRPPINSKEKDEMCRPHMKACEATGRTIGDFADRLRKNERFRRRYTEIMGPPPPVEEITELWLMTIDSHIHNAKHGHASSIQFLLRHLDERFKPKKVGRPSGGSGSAPPSSGASEKDRAKAAQQMYASMLSQNA